MVREQFEQLLHGDPAWGKPMEKVVGATFEFVEFLDKVLKVDLSEYSLPALEPTTYHYTCHLRGIGLKDEGVRLLKQVGNVDFRQMEKTDQCCGFGGTFAIKYPGYQRRDCRRQSEMHRRHRGKNTHLQRRGVFHEHQRHVSSKRRGGQDTPHR